MEQYIVRVRDGGTCVLGRFLSVCVGLCTYRVDGCWLDIGIYDCIHLPMSDVVEVAFALGASMQGHVGETSVGNEHSLGNWLYY